MPGLWERLTGLLGWVPPDEEYAEEEREYEDFPEDRAWGEAAAARDPDSSREEWRRPTGRRSRVVRLPGRGAEERGLRVAVAEPEGFEQVQVIADHLKRDVSVVVNVESLDRGVARRIIDFLAGCVYALDGEMQKVSAGVVLFVTRKTHIDVVRQMAEGDDRRRNEDGGVDL